MVCGPANIAIGSRSDASPSEYLSADVSEIMVYDHALDSDEQSAAEGYLADKYGLDDAFATWPLAYSSDVQALISANHWNKAHADAYVAFTGTDHPFTTDDLTCWLTADTGVTADGSGNVSFWTDESVNGNGRHPVERRQPTVAGDECPSGLIPSFTSMVRANI